MAKAPKKKKQKQAPAPQNKRKTPVISSRTLDIVLPLILVVVFIFLLKPLVIDGLSPQGVDVLASVGQKNQINEYHKKTGERALWNPFIFSGMPTYQRINAQAPSVDTILQALGRLFRNVFVYYIMAIVGMYLLLRYLGMSPLSSFIATCGFVLIPHYKSLWLEGHFTKFRALMLIPWIVLAFNFFESKRNILSAALFALAFGVQIRTQHYQIIFYTGVLILSIGLYPFIRDLIERKWGRFTKSTVLLFAAIILAIGMAAQPLFLAREYLPYSKRGKTTINLQNPQTNPEKIGESSGVTLEYATRWSTHPSELFTWIIPRFYGGMSQEMYQGDEQPRLRNRPIPGYWGHMPFTQSYEYAGLLIIILAIMGLVAQRRNRFVIGLSVFGLFLILLSFGRHFSAFYSIFYYYLPFFNKFRAPMMSVTVNFFIFNVLAAYGLVHLKNLVTGGELFKKYRNEMIIMGVFVVIGILAWLIGQSASFTKPGGENYEPQILNMLKSARAELFFQDLMRYFGFLAAFIALVVLYLKQKINFAVLGVVMALLVILDLVSIRNRVDKEYTDIDRLERQYFKETQTDRFLKSDDDLFRILPAGKLFGDNRWAFHHQSIGGYSPIKMYTIEELIENNLYQGWEPALPFNWNVLKILNVKYVVLQGQVEHENLELVHSEPSANLYTYRYRDSMPRGFFSGSHTVIADPYQRLKVLNTPAGDPEQALILEKELSTPVETPDSSFARVTRFEPNRTEFEVYTDKTSLFAISELFYPPGWHIYLDDEEVTDIYKTHHAIQSIIVPPGNHTVRLHFAPESFEQNLNLAYMSVGIIYLTILIALGITYYPRLKGTHKTE